MLAPKPGADSWCGPFFSESSLNATLEELTKIALQAAQVFTRFFKPRVKADFAAKLDFAAQADNGMEEFTGRPANRKQAAELRAMMERLP